MYQNLSPSVYSDGVRVTPMEAKAEIMGAETMSGEADVRREGWREVRLFERESQRTAAWSLCLPMTSTLFPRGPAGTGAWEFSIFSINPPLRASLREALSIFYIQKKCGKHR